MANRFWKQWIYRVVSLRWQKSGYTCSATSERSWLPILTNDIAYIIGTYFPYNPDHQLKVPSKQIRINQQKIICQHFNFHRYDKQMRTGLRNIAHVNSGRLRVKSEIEQHIIHECTRLIANAIIYFNAELLTNLIDVKSSNIPLMAEQVKKISPVAWQHINFYGRFEFIDLETPFDAEEFMNTLDLSKWFTALDPVY